MLANPVTQFVENRLAVRLLSTDNDVGGEAQLVLQVGLNGGVAGVGRVADVGDTEQWNDILENDRFRWLDFVVFQMLDVLAGHLLETPFHRWVNGCTSLFDDRHDALVFAIENCFTAAAIWPLLTRICDTVA